MHGAHARGQALAGESIPERVYCLPYHNFAKPAPVTNDVGTSSAWQHGVNASSSATQVKLNRGMDYPSLDDVLVDMKLTPEVLELPCPAYFRDERAKVCPAT